MDHKNFTRVSRSEMSRLALTTPPPAATEAYQRRTRLSSVIIRPQVQATQRYLVTFVIKIAYRAFTDGRLGTRASIPSLTRYKHPR